MYIFASVSKYQNACLIGLARSRGVSVASFVGWIIGGYLSGRLRYVAVNDQQKTEGALPAGGASTHE